MKTKLLKKVRKQYCILYNKDGHYYGDTHFKEMYVLVNKNNEYDIKFSDNKKILIDTILIWVRYDYPNLGKRKRRNNKTIKVWYNE